MSRMRARWRLFLLSAAALLALAARDAAASTYYVDPAGNDDGPGTAEAPWQTIQHAASTLLPGDTVIVQPGIYAEAVYVSTSGSAGAPITFQAQPGAILESPYPGASLSAFDVQPGVGDVVLDGFEARDGFGETIFVRYGGHDIVISNCNVHHNQVGIWIDSASNIEVDNCQIHDNTGLGMRVSGTSQFVTVSGTVSSNNNDGLGCNGKADGFTVEETTSNVTFVNARAAGNGQDGFDLQGDAVMVSGSASQNNTCAGIKLAQNARVENSLITGNTTGIGTSSYFNAPVTMTIINSTVADNSGTQMFFRDPNVPTGETAVPYNVVVRNVVASGLGKAIEAAANVLLTEDHDVFFREDTTSGLIVQHLLSGGERRYSGQAINAGIWTADSGQGNGTWAIKPDFVDTVTYQVAADSVVIDDGDGTAAPNLDRSGAARPQGNAIDIGPDESPNAVTNHRPWADPGPDRSTLVLSHVNFSAYGSVDPDGSPLTYSWDFGDGSAPANGYNVSHTYTTGGTFTVTLTVSDGTLTRSRTAVVTVAPGSAGTVHDSVMLPLPPLTFGLWPGMSSLTIPLRVVVLNADYIPRPELPGHVIQVVADPGTCPPGTLATSPSFVYGANPPQDSMLLPGGRGAAAWFTLSINRDAFTSPGGRAVARCVMHFSALGPGTDPTPDNNTIDVELNVIDLNDSASTLVPDTAIRSMGPLTLVLWPGQASNQWRIPFVITNVDPDGWRARQTHMVTVTARDGTCPPGVVQGVDVDLRTPGNQSSTSVYAGWGVVGLLNLSIDANAFTTTSLWSRARCSISVEVSDPDDMAPANNVTNMQIDVVDANDL
jgi:parallel beta-helix repeat protein